MWLCVLFFFCIFSKFYYGFSVAERALRVDNVTKFQLFAEQLPLFQTPLYTHVTPLLVETQRIPTICSVLGNGFGCGSKPKRTESLKATCLKTPPQNYINLPDASTPSQRGRRLCGSMQSLSQSLSLSHSPTGLAKRRAKCKESVNPCCPLLSTLCKCKSNYI